MPKSTSCALLLWVLADEDEEGLVGVKAEVRDEEGVEEGGWEERLGGIVEKGVVMGIGDRGLRRMERWTVREIQAG